MDKPMSKPASVVQHLLRKRRCLPKTVKPLERLSELDQIEYDQIRKTEAKKLGIRASTLDNEMAKLREKGYPGNPFGTPVEPWP